MPRRKLSESPIFDSADNDFDDDISSNDDKNPPIQRNAANARERARMRVLSSAFFRLKKIIPWVPHDTKLSKLDTLRLARNYIAYLTATLDGQPVEEISSNMSQPPKMTWPYIFQQMPELNQKPGSNVTNTNNNNNTFNNNNNNSNNHNNNTLIDNNNISDDQWNPMAAMKNSIYDGNRHQLLYNSISIDND